jgi:hypothetical protein
MAIRAGGLECCWRTGGQIVKLRNQTTLAGWRLLRLEQPFH